jgi:hypothetical protein
MFVHLMLNVYSFDVKNKPKYRQDLQLIQTQKNQKSKNEQKYSIESNLIDHTQKSPADNNHSIRIRSLITEDC